MIKIAKKVQFTWPQLSLFVLASIFALIFGIIAVTSNLILVGLAMGIVIGIFLLTDPKKTIWLVLGLGLISPAILDMLGTGYYKILWAISIMAMLLIVPGLLNTVDLNLKLKRDIPVFVWLAILFFCLSLLTTLIQLHSVGELLTGLRRYFQAYGLMLVLATLFLTRKDFNQWLKFLLYIAFLQLPFAIYERLVLVSQRDNLANWGASATDVVAGTFGANLYTGSPNAIMVCYILLASAFLISRWRFGFIKTKHLILMVSLMLAPIFLGETKIVILLIPMMTLVLFRKGFFDNVSKTIIFILVMLVLTLTIAYYYVYILLESNFIEAYLGVMRYNIGNVGYGDNLLNRFTVMTMWWESHGIHEPINLLFGHGLGSSYGSQISTGHIAQQFMNYGINLTTISTILWDLGLVGLILYVSIFIFMWIKSEQIYQRSKSKLVKADCLAVQVGIAFTLLFLFYSDSQVNLMTHEIIVALLIGYTAFMYKEEYEEHLHS